MCRVKATVAGDSRLAVLFDFYNFTGRRSFVCGEHCDEFDFQKISLY